MPAPVEDRGLAEALERHRGRLRWRHVLVTVLGALIELIALGYASVILFPDKVPARTADARAVAEAGPDVLPAFVLLYLAGALIASYGYAGFDRRRTIRKLPLVVALSLFVTLLALAGVFVGSIGGGGSGDGGGGGGRSRRSQRANPARVQAARDASVACQLLDLDLAARIMGGPVSQPEPSTSRLMRMSSAECNGPNGTGDLVLMVRPLSARTKRRAHTRRAPDGRSYLGNVVQHIEGSWTLCEQDWQLVASVRGRDTTPATAAAVSELLTGAMARLRRAGSDRRTSGSVTQV